MDAVKSIILVFCLAVGISADCDNDIEIQGVTTTNANDRANGFYVRHINDGCDNRDVFNHTTNNLYLFHIGGDDAIQGYWIVRDSFDCVNNDENDGIIRANDIADNPGLVQFGWQEYQSGSWNARSEIDVDCYEWKSCNYRITGATNSSLNAQYNKYGDGNVKCEFRNVHKHESMEMYLYMVYSNQAGEYCWMVNSQYCVDAYTTAPLRNDDYATTPALVLDSWRERQTDGSYLANSNVDVDCYDNDLSAGAIAGIVIGCLAGVAIIGGLIWFCACRD